MKSFVVSDILFAGSTDLKFEAKNSTENSVNEMNFYVICNKTSESRS